MKHEIDNILVSSKNGVITQKDLQIAINDYLDMLPDSEMIKTKVQCFDGLIRYLYKCCIKPILNRDKQGYIDYDLLNDIYESVYLYLCNLFGYIPNMLLFCNLVNIPLSNISNNIYNYNDCYDSSNSVIGNEVISKRIEYIKRWRDSMESSLVSQVANNNSIGSMFLLKSVYGYSENNTIKIDMTNETPQIDAKQLAAIAQTNIPGHDHE